MSWWLSDQKIWPLFSAGSELNEYLNRIGLSKDIIECYIQRPTNDRFTQCYLLQWIRFVWKYVWKILKSYFDMFSIIKQLFFYRSMKLVYPCISLDETIFHMVSKTSTYDRSPSNPLVEYFTILKRKWRWTWKLILQLWTLMNKKPNCDDF